MSKAFMWVAGVAAVVWFLSEDNSTPAASTYAPIQGSAGVSGRYGDVAAEDEDDDGEAEERSEAVRQAKQEFEDAADELRAAVDALRHNRWDGQMSTIRSRLEDADDALAELEGLRPDDPAVLTARDEVDSMRSHLARLHHENWRTVRPDLDASSSAIEDEAGSASEDEDEE